MTKLPRTKIGPTRMRGPSVTIQVSVTSFPLRSTSGSTVGRRVAGVAQQAHQALGVGGDRGRRVGGARAQRQAVEQESRVVGEGGAVGAAQILGAPGSGAVPRRW